MVKIQNGLYVNPDKVNSVFIVDDCVTIKKEITETFKNKFLNMEEKS